ncbi:MAG: PBP1A family penicillin-binding protein [Lachnospiraceae bacterium]|mgnify:CR=1 FL=1|jgi:penicillin-binding protein 1A|uniref:PBP1A family penicillin-binding protein n=1 Tax=Candidatus Merdisoma sp. JLR.KK011 TaxID=3114299 RepID=UPI001434E098|nr:PBP1A family penicillin-binding protein [Lachnospiraceae bacterium]MCI9383590.1 PBP1A family penicillin-binding protein [Lachnospiraceae bacterium]MCI9479443.1 PBP1A family penicillin-binding protein [Lachnospiraceae bacterium]MCI9623833.1 PBP1A family penicillin-binding protein [Lachnospiraceae bacterium]GFI09142.1 penicillin-binding protein 1A [Lachnospiraceae bacterium]
MNYGKRGTSKKQRSMNSKTAKVGKKASVVFIKAFLICILATGVAGLCAGVGIVKGVIDNAPPVETINVVPRGYKSIMMDANGNQITELVEAGSNRIWVDIEDVPQHVQDAFVAIEDERFYEHNGIDLKGIIRAGVRGIASGFKRTEGASTITQQLLKNSVFDFMSESTTAEKVERKLQEQYLAVELEKSMSKEEILQAYLNTINLGQNALGIQAAANRYFNKDVKDLTISEAAVIAGTTKSPTGYNPISNQEKNQERRDLVLDHMLKQGYISQAEYDEAMEDDVYARIQITNEVKSNTEVFSYYVDAVIDQVINDLQEVKGYTPQQAYNLVYSGGLTIETAQDPEIQAIMDEEMGNPENYPANVRIGLDYALTVVKPDGEQKNYSKEMMEAYFKKNESANFELLFDTEEEAQSYIDAYKATLVEEGDTIYERADMTIQPQASMVVMDQATGYVKGIVGGRGEKKASLSLNRAVDTVRQPGSTFKVVSTYAPALDSAGMSLATTQFDAPYSYTGGRPVRNWNGEAYKGWTSLRKGIEQSMNILAVKTLTDITPALGITYLENMGITTLQKELDANGNNDYTQAMALGGLTRGVTNLELTAAYATIANGGVYTKPVFYTRILDHDKNVLIDNTKSYTRTVLKDSTAWLLTSAMKDVVTQGTGGAVRFSGMTIAGKTGTTSKNNDVWFVGYTPYYTAGIWGGFDNNHKLGKGETSYHKVIWKNVMSRIHENLENKDFPKPESVTSATVCAASGKLPIPGLCDGMMKSEYFAVGSTPTEYCNVHVAGEACVESGGLATDACPVHEYRVITLMPENNDVSGSPLVAPPCPLHLGNLIGGIVQPNAVDGTMPDGMEEEEGEVQPEPEDEEIPPEE